MSKLDRYDLNILALLQKDATLSNQELAERIGITPANLAVLKNGRAKAVRFGTLEALCRELDCQPADLLRYEP